MQNRHSAPPPDLRIIRVDQAHPHEEHDNQRAQPLINRLRHDETFNNPPIVASLGASQFVVLDGANRHHAFKVLEYPHIMVQVASYESGYVDLETWQHVLSGWSGEAFLRTLQESDSLRVVDHQSDEAVAHIVLRDGTLIALEAPVNTTHERNAALQHVVHTYQQKAKLNRTAIAEPDEIWPLFPQAFGVVIFPRYTPGDIIAAAKYGAFLPSGITRHIIHGRALAVNYPLHVLSDRETKLADKNEALRKWIQNKLANRQVRYYAETTYQFNE